MQSDRHLCHGCTPLQQPQIMDDHNVCDGVVDNDKDEKGDKEIMLKDTSHDYGQSCHEEHAVL